MKGLRFANFQKKGGEGGGSSDFSHKNGGVDKIKNKIKKELLLKKMEELLLKGGVSLIFRLTNLFHCYLCLSVWCVCVCVCVCVSVFYLFTQYLSVLSVFHWKNLVL